MLWKKIFIQMFFAERPEGVVRMVHDQNYRPSPVVKQSTPEITTTLFSSFCCVTPSGTGHFCIDHA
jgi:coenzyme F420-reducing hydrogenase beta subunit